MKCLILTLLLNPFIHCKWDPDYWTGDFDKTKNCKREKDIMRLQKEAEGPDAGMSRCSYSTTG